MREIFTTRNLPPEARLRTTLNFLEETQQIVDTKPLTDEPFRTTIETGIIGGVGISRAKTSPTIANLLDNRSEQLLIVQFKLVGSGNLIHGDASVKLAAGDMIVYNNEKLATFAHQDASDSLHIVLPRATLERSLGPASAYTMLNVNRGLATNQLARAYLLKLIETSAGLDPIRSTQMMNIGIDLIVAGIAERMAQETPHAVSGSLLLERAKAYIEANLHNPSLDPPTLAAAMGVSLRRLQQLFYERGRHISDWIWQRRLEHAAKQLSDPGTVHLSIGYIAYSIGFSNQAHFSTRFRAVSVIILK